MLKEVLILHRTIPLIHLKNNNKEEKVEIHHYRTHFSYQNESKNDSTILKLQYNWVYNNKYSTFVAQKAAIG